jgi:hypothetical protein
MSQYPVSNDRNVNLTATTITPTDRVRWGPILAGLFAALSTRAILTILGIAVAGSTYDPGDSARAFGIGAGIWSAISALIAFFIGGWVAARSAALRGHSAGLLNGTMVWAVAIPLMLYLVMGGIGSLFQTTATTISQGASAATKNDRSGEAQTASARIAPNDTVKNAANSVGQTVTNPDNQRDAAHATAKGAWGTLISLLLGLAAAAFGGYAGSRTSTGRDHDVNTTRESTSPGAHV